MKYIFIVQGDGRGHLTQAISLSDMLRRNGHEVLEVLVGKSKARKLPPFFYDKVKAPVSLFDSPSFIFNKDRKRVNTLKTFLYNVIPSRLKNYGRSMAFINARIEKLKPDVVINFYEILAGLTYWRFRPKVKLISIAHQYLTLHPDYRFGKGNSGGLFSYKLITKITCIGSSKLLGLSFYSMPESSDGRVVVVPPLLRKEVFGIRPEKKDFVLGYMLNQGFEVEIRQWHKEHPEQELHFFWDNKSAPKELKVDATLTFLTLDDQLFLKYMAECKAYISTAGFESVCEAFYMQKPVMMIPAHVEQEVNAKDASSTGLGIEGNSFDVSKLLSFAENYTESDTFAQWISQAEGIFLKQLVFN